MDKGTLQPPHLLTLRNQNLTSHGDPNTWTSDLRNFQTSDGHSWPMKTHLGSDHTGPVIPPPVTPCPRQQPGKIA